MAKCLRSKTKIQGAHAADSSALGYESEADPVAVARKIDAALAAGINVFMYD